MKLNGQIIQSLMEETEEAFVLDLHGDSGAAQLLETM